MSKTQTAKILKQGLIKERLQELSEEKKIAEKKEDEEGLQALRVEFNNLASHFK